MPCYLIGTDEAGYAPNLGPLVISATVWQVEGDEANCDLYKLLRRVICKSPSQRTGVRRLALADSKLLYRPPHGLSLLERAVLAMLSLVGRCPQSWREIWPLVEMQTGFSLPELPWHVDYETTLPVDADCEDLARLIPKLQQGFAAAGVRLLAIRSAVVFPEQFNSWTEDCGNKGEVLSQITLRLVGEGLRLCSDGAALIVCDKHGGRNRYGRLLQQQFPDSLIEVYRESLQESVYRWGQPERRIEARFRVGGEEFLPAALASMTSKYLRELAMRAFNDFWCQRVKDLLPTAGYPLDARRFKSEIATLQSDLGIHDRVVWRAR